MIFWFGDKKEEKLSSSSPLSLSKQAPHLLSKLLLVVDGSDPSIAAARFAVQLAQQLGSEILAVYVIDTATMDYLTQMHILVKEEREDFEKSLEQTGKRYLNFVETLATKEKVSLQTILTRGSYHQRILAEAENHRVDAIILGGWKRTIMRKDRPSVERQLILDEAICPVIVIKSPSEEK